MKVIKQEDGLKFIEHEGLRIRLTSLASPDSYTVLSSCGLTWSETDGYYSIHVPTKSMYQITRLFKDRDYICSEETPGAFMTFMKLLIHSGDSIHFLVYYFGVKNETKLPEALMRTSWDYLAAISYQGHGSSRATSVELGQVLEITPEKIVNCWQAGN